jgi:hypothetical protein
MKKVFLIVLAVGLIIVSTLLSHISLVIAVGPFGATVNPLTSDTASEDPAQGIPAVAGNVTELNIFGYSVTQSWQGYFGNVTGVITLEDNGGNVMYNWSETSPEGEIYASKNDTIAWGNIQCFNFTATGTYLDDTGNAGQTSQYGTNITILENMFNIESDDSDGVDETFTLSGIGTHERFFTSQKEFSEGECMSTRVFSNIDAGEDDKFEEVLLYEPSTYSVIFAGLLNEDEVGFDDNPHDFEMLVLEDGHGTDTSTDIYYFYVELE